MSFSKSAYSSRVVPVADLDEQTIKNMMTLYFSAYDGTNTEIFLSDLRSKDKVIQIFQGKHLIGFTTLHIFQSHWDGRGIRVIYSGDTIIERAHWGQMELLRAWIQEIRKIQNENPIQPHYWFLLVKGHRTYKYLSTFARSFFPDPQGKFKSLKPLADMLASNMFGNLYDLESGIVKFPDKRGQLKPSIALPSEAEMSQPDVSYFIAANPDYTGGDELVCVCSLDIDNMKPFAKRIAEKSSSKECVFA